MEIKLDKSTLPQDGQYIWFKLLNLLEFHGYFIDEPQLFNVCNDGGDNEGDFFPAWKVIEWEPR